MRQEDGMLIFNNNLALEAFIILRGEDGVHYLSWQSLENLAHSAALPDLRQRTMLSAKEGPKCFIV